MKWFEIIKTCVLQQNKCTKSPNVNIIQTCLVLSSTNHRVHFSKTLICHPSPDGRTLSTGSNDKLINIWKLSGRLVFPYQSDISTNDLEEKEVPHEFICPITQDVMKWPVRCSGEKERKNERKIIVKNGELRTWFEKLEFFPLKKFIHYCARQFASLRMQVEGLQKGLR